MDIELREKLKEIRKLEREAKQLLRKMDRIESEWNLLKIEIEQKGRDIPQTLGDILSGWKKK